MTLISKSVCVLFVALFFFSGCISQGPLENTKNPLHEWEIESLDFENISEIALSYLDAKLIPLFSPICKNQGIRVSVTNESTNIDSDYSLFSSRLAITFWDESEEVIVVDNYEHLLQASAIACLKNIPIVVHGKSTWAAIDKLRARNIITIGDVPINGGKHLEDQETIWNYTIQTAKEKGVLIDYLAVANPNDEKNLVPNLSSFSSLLAALRNGMVVTCKENSSETINRAIKNAVWLLNESKMKAKYVCLVGDSESIPFFKVKVESYGKTATDNHYGDLDGNTLVPELFVGRFFARDLMDASALFNRYIGYEDYFASESIENLNWQNIASVIYGTFQLYVIPGMTIFAGTSSIAAMKTFIEAGFTTLISGEDISWVTANPYMDKSNYIFISGAHGTPYQMDCVNVRTLSMHPSVIFANSCSVGRIDDVNIRDCIVSWMIHNGLVIFVASTREAAVGVEIETPPYDNYGNQLGRFFFEDLVKNNTAGECLKNAKDRYYLQHKQNWDETHDTATVYEFVLYGDPAFNPYEPCNEGATS